MTLVMEQDMQNVTVPELFQESCGERSVLNLFPQVSEVEDMERSPSGELIFITSIYSNSLNSNKTIYHVGNLFFKSGSPLCCLNSICVLRVCGHSMNIYLLVKWMLSKKWFITRLD